MKYVLGTHEGCPLTSSVVSFLQEKSFKVIQTKSWTEAMTMCQHVTFDIIVGCCNIDAREVNRIIKKINSHYITNNKSAASIILQEHNYLPTSEQLPSIREYLKGILPKSIAESELIALLSNIPQA